MCSAEPGNSLSVTQLAMGLLWHDKRNREATLQDRVTGILALIDSRN